MCACRSSFVQNVKMLNVECDLSDGELRVLASESVERERDAFTQTQE